MNLYRQAVTIPGLPSLENRFQHWRKTQKERLHWQQLVAYAFSGKKPKKPLEKCVLIYTRCTADAPDFDNMTRSYKGVQDGLVKAGIIKDDTLAVIVDRGYFFEKTSRKDACIKIEVMEVTENYRPRQPQDIIPI